MDPASSSSFIQSTRKVSIDQNGIIATKTVRERTYSNVPPEQINDLEKELGKEIVEGKKSLAILDKLISPGKISTKGLKGEDKEIAKTAKKVLKYEKHSIKGKELEFKNEMSTYYSEQMKHVRMLEHELKTLNLHKMQGAATQTENKIRAILIDFKGSDSIGPDVNRYLNNWEGNLQILDSNGNDIFANYKEPEIPEGTPDDRASALKAAHKLSYLTDAIFIQTGMATINSEGGVEYNESAKAIRDRLQALLSEITQKENITFDSISKPIANFFLELKDGKIEGAAKGDSLKLAHVLNAFNQNYLTSLFMGGNLSIMVGTEAKGSPLMDNKKGKAITLQLHNDGSITQSYTAKGIDKNINYQNQATVNPKFQVNTTASWNLRFDGDGKPEVDNFHSTTHVILSSQASEDDEKNITESLRFAGYHFDVSKRDEQIAM